MSLGVSPNSSKRVRRRPARSGMESIPQLGIYVHLPFCSAICPYCDFAKEPWRLSRERRYLAALNREISQATPREATTIFIGGGTPNRTAASAIVDLLALLRDRFAMPPAAEVSIELNPDPRLCEDFSIYRQAGISRLSFGVQSFLPAELRRLGRSHTAEDIAVVVARAKEHGFDRISLDLIFGVPEQSLADLDRSLDAALALDVGHISCYGLTIEEGTPFHREHQAHPERFAEQDHEARLYERLIERLTAAGYEQYELSNFARPGHRCAHNANYWNNGEYLGFGVGAASYIAGERRTTTADVDAYCTALEQSETVPSTSESLVGEARAGEAMMLGLRRLEGVRLAAFDARYGVESRSLYREAITTYTEAGLLEHLEDTLRLTPAGRLLANTVCAAFLAPATSYA